MSSNFLTYFLRRYASLGAIQERERARRSNDPRYTNQEFWLEVLGDEMDETERYVQLSFSALCESISSERRT